MNSNFGEDEIYESIEDTICKGDIVVDEGDRTHNYKGFRGCRNYWFRWWIRFELLNLNIFYIFCFENWLALGLGLIKK